MKTYDLRDYDIKVAYEKERRGTKVMAKFKVGDRVRILNVPSLNIYERHYVDCEFVVGEVYVSFSAPTVYKLIGNIYFYSDKELELVEPKEDKPYKKPLILTPYSRTDILVNGKIKKYSIEKIERPCNMPNEPERLQVTFIELTEKLPSQELPNQDPFKLNPHEFDETKTPFSDSLDSIGYILKKIEKPFAPFPYYHMGFDEALYTKPPKNRIPDRVVFNQDKGKVTVLISKHLDGVAPYWAYTSKVHGDDKFDYLYGFLMAYFKMVHRDKSKTQLKKYLNAIVYPMTKKEQTAFLQGVFYENCGLGFKEAKEYLEKIKVKKWMS